MFSRQTFFIYEDDSNNKGRSSRNSEENSLEYENFGEEEGEGVENNEIEEDTDTKIKEAIEYRNRPQQFSAATKNKHVIEPSKAAILSVISRDKQLPFNWRKASNIKKSHKLSRYFLKPGYYSTICSIMFVRKRSKQNK